MTKGEKKIRDDRRGPSQLKFLPTPLDRLFFSCIKRNKDATKNS